MQIVHAIFNPGEGEKAVTFLSTLGIEEGDLKLIKSESGDLLIIKLLYGDTNEILDNLRNKFNFRINSGRSLIIFSPDSVFPRDQKKLETNSFRAARDSLISYAQDKSSLTMNYIILVILSSVITSLGLILNNVAVIVGGMVIAPVLGPILAITIGIVLGEKKLIKKGVAAEIIAILFAVLVGLLFGLIMPNVEVNESLRIRMFPTLADLFIATAAGAAGAFALVKGQLESGLVGVMVAASLLPVMSTIGIGISLGNPTMIFNPILLLVGNYLSLLLANIVVFYFQGLRPQIWFKHKANSFIKKSLYFIILSVLILSIPLGIITIYQFYVEKPVDVIKSTIRESLVLKYDYRVESVEIVGNLINVYIYAENKIDNKILMEIKKDIEKGLAREYNINFKMIPVKEVKM